MQITYHKDCQSSNPEHFILFPHCALAEEIQRYMRVKNCVQAHYRVYATAHFVFIQLLNGDRVDCLYDFDIEL